MKLLANTQIGVSLSLAIVTKSDGNTQLTMNHLADVTTLALWFWLIWRLLDAIVMAVKVYLRSVLIGYKYLFHSILASIPFQIGFWNENRGFFAGMEWNIGW